MISLKDYDHKESEKKWKEYWEKNKIYKFNQNSKKPIYSIDTPPPTVSGKMHMGHAFSYSQQDFIVRFHRMNQKNIFYPFGTDDNGLPTERLIEKEKSVKAQKLKREEFIKLCLDYLEKHLPIFIQDWKDLGISCDWDIYYSTINEHSRRISQRSFIELYNQGREYRKKTPFMWCPECQTAIAQVELKDKETESEFVYISFDTSLNKQITIATTRPELMPACVAIHIHPEDKRYKEFIGKKAKIPFSNREVEIYSNKDVDMNFGSGAVYHCTFGDMDDAEWIQKFNIKPIEVMNKDGTFNELAGKYKGLKSKEARKKIIEDLKKEGRIKKIEPITHIVNVHERCETEIEILMTEQWFIKYLDLKEEFLKSGKQLNWYPKHFISRYENWIKGLKWDWCISRQRYFGIPFPVWYCEKCKKIKLAEIKDLPVDPLVDKPKTKCSCGNNTFTPEKDVLDTWATSSLTPQLAIELIKDKSLQKKLFPMSLRPQAHDIITFWLFNTLVKSQLHYKKNPWKDVSISGWALDPKGKKMSKSKGNVIDPKEKLQQYGADVLRFWAAGSKLGEDLPFQEKDLVTGKKFVTKLWNASKFTLMHLENYNQKKPKELELMDKWLLLKLNKLIETSTKSFENYEYVRTKLDTENFFWNIFCDYYLEIVKDRLYNPDKRSNEAKLSAQYTLYKSLSIILKLMSPITPFITEEIYQSYFSKKEKVKSIHISEWPKNEKIDKNIEKIGDKFIEIITEVRKFKSKNNKSLKEPIILTLDKKDFTLIKPALEDLKSTVKADEIKQGKFEIGFIK